MIDLTPDELAVKVVQSKLWSWTPGIRYTTTHLEKSSPQSLQLTRAVARVLPGEEHLMDGAVPVLDDIGTVGAMIVMLDWRLKSITRQFAGGYFVDYSGGPKTRAAESQVLGHALAIAIIRCGVE